MWEDVMCEECVWESGRKPCTPSHRDGGGGCGGCGGMMGRM